MKLAQFVFSLIRLSEKAANVARAMRSEKKLFELLLEQKDDKCKNKKFVQDFKTLGDVLIQEMVTHELAKEFQGIEKNIHGEENNKFTNTLGESIEVSIQPTPAQTGKLLAKVLDGNKEAAEILSAEIHKDVSVDPIPALDSIQKELDVNDVGVWIDPIDSTAQYIAGQEHEHPQRGIYEEGLQCVVVIIGVFSTKTGQPIAGICNQPFSKLNEKDKWESRYMWGICYEDIKCNHIPEVHLGGVDKTKLFAPDSSSSGSKRLSIVTSSSEKAEILDQLDEKFNLQHAAGAGYKVLCVIDRLATSYITSSPSTFKWDTCGPDAIIRSMGGAILNLGQVRKKIGDKTSADLQDSDIYSILEECFLKYHSPDDGYSSRDEGDRWSNSGGILAYADPKTLKTVISALIDDK